MTEALSLAAGIRWAAATLSAAGAPAVIDPADVQLPGVICYPATIEFEYLDQATFTLGVDLVFVASGASQADALDQLAALVSAARSVLPITELRAVTARLAGQSADPLPALVCTVTLQVTPPADDE